MPFFPQGRIGRRGLPIGLRAVYGREWNAGDGDWSGINITKLRQGKVIYMDSHIRVIGLLWVKAPQVYSVRANFGCAYAKEGGYLGAQT